MSVCCPVCQRDVKNTVNLIAHMRAKHPDHTPPKHQKRGPKPRKALPAASPAPPGATDDQERYAKKNAHAAARQARITLAGRDIAPLPAVVDPARRERCRLSLLEHCKTYHASAFYCPFSPNHLKAIQKAERVILNSGVYALAMPRGSGKSLIAKIACEWAILHGHRRFIVLVAATGPLADNLMAEIQAQLEFNNELAEDFPEAIYPIRKLNHTPSKARGQLYDGEPTRLEWTSDRVTLAHLPGSICAGSTILTAGITASFRGLSTTGPDGTPIRPDLVLVDDPQSRESAASLSQCETRLQIIQGDILGLAGPTKKVACLLTCTVINPGDVADQLLDRKQSPAWQGERTKMVNAFPTNHDRWDEYFRIRDEELRSDGDGKLSRAYYLSHQEEMDAGAVLSWPERFDPNAYASAVEEAMCFKHDRPDAFAAEAQNEPLLSQEIAAGALTLAGLREKSNKLDRGVAPRDATRLTCGIDVQHEILFWCVTAWDETGGGAVVDFGTYPKQNRPHFAARDARPTLSAAFPTLDEAARIYAGLKALTDELLIREFPRETAGHMKIDRALIDAGDGTFTEPIKRFVRQSQHGRALLPSKGRGLSEAQVPLMEWPRKPGQLWGNGWMLSQDRLLHFCTNTWKTQVANRLLTPPAGKGCLYLPGGNVSHFAEHLIAEYRTSKVYERAGRKTPIWDERPGRPDNHWWDALVMSAVAASIEGVRYDVAAAATAANSGAPQAPPPPAPRRQYQDPRELQRQARQMSRGR